MSVSEILSRLRLNRDFMANVVVWERIKPQPARTTGFSANIPSRLEDGLRQRGISQLYTHQTAALNSIAEGAHVAIATATASGKSLCYTLPVLDRLTTRPTSRALYLFPTKALAHDQLAETAALVQAGRLPVPINSYDGDTPQSQRRRVRHAEGILFTNPDMLHAGLLPYHTRWRDLFRNLEFVVLDEIHAYRGVFGSHVANVIRRLHRICEFYGSNPQFICCSATIANPKEHAERLLERPITLIDESKNGAPRGEKHFILFNPPIIDEKLGLRSSTILAAKDAAVTFLSEDVQTIVFARARQTVELILAYLRDELEGVGKGEAVVTGYRGGYLPQERREIESGLKTGVVRGVVATNALELGIDIGELDVALLTGYPGSIASTWQQAGRAGRHADQSASILIAGNGPLDQYICNHPRYLFGRSPEHALTNPDNVRIISKHLLCATFELPFQEGESFGGFGPADELLEELKADGYLHLTRGQYHWLGEGIPAHAVSLRTGGTETVIIHDVEEEAPVVIGEVDLESAPLLAHEGAIYMHQARSYLVEALDWDGRIVHARPVEVDYYTRASVGSTIRTLRPENEQIEEGMTRAYGEVSVVTKATGYRKIKRYTHETLGFGDIDLPEILLETSGYWVILTQSLAEQLYELGILLRPNDYGPNWQKRRREALDRDAHRCRSCGASDQTGLHVHHIRPFREFGYVPGRNENYRQANELDNLMTLCSSCHRRAEAGQHARSALGGLAYVLRNLAPLFLMCDPGDIEVIAENRSPLTRAPTIVIYERVAAGVGFSQRLFELHGDLWSSALELVIDCRCRDGCPACVGPPTDIGPDTKVTTRQLLQILTRQESR